VTACTSVRVDCTPPCVSRLDSYLCGFTTHRVGEYLQISMLNVGAQSKNIKGFTCASSRHVSADVIG
jgi:hypothetical protein